MSNQYVYNVLLALRLVTQHLARRLSCHSGHVWYAHDGYYNWTRNRNKSLVFGWVCAVHLFSFLGCPIMCL